MKANNHSLFTRPIAHRGLHDEKICENSLSSFKKAVERGYNIELDARMSKDQCIIVHHDDNLKRMTGVDIDIDIINSDELKKYPMINSQEIIPTLKEVLDLVEGKVTILIELKIKNEFNPEFPEAVLKVLDEYPYKDKIALQSFNPYAMKWLKQKSCPYLLGQLSSGNLEDQKLHIKFLFKTLLVNRISKPDFIAYDITHLPNFYVKRARHKGYKILSWTIDDKDKLKKALRYSDQIIFEKVAF
jgi:glycerophosphoryl diester phosphodiesterase